MQMHKNCSNSSKRLKVRYNKPHIMNAFLARMTVVILSYGVAVFAAVYFGVLYDYLFPYTSGGGFIGDPDTLNWMIGYPLAVIFFLTFLVHAQGIRHVWWWNLGALIPAILFEIVFTPTQIYIPIILGFIAWGLGILAHKLLQKFVPVFMTKLG